MTTKDTVRENLLNYPILFKNALDVYDHLFCVCGNGYRWKDGELVSTSTHRRLKTKAGAALYQIKKLITDRMQWKVLMRLVGLVNAARTMMRRARLIVSRVLDVDKNIVDLSIKDDEEMAKHFGDYKFSFYPLSSYSTICNLPDDIKLDWLQAAKKMYGIMIANLDAMNGGEELLPSVKERIEELEKNRQI